METTNCNGVLQWPPIALNMLAERTLVFFYRTLDHATIQCDKTFEV